MKRTLLNLALSLVVALLFLTSCKDEKSETINSNSRNLRGEVLGNFPIKNLGEYNNRYLFTDGEKLYFGLHDTIPAADGSDKVYNFTIAAYDPRTNMMDSVWNITNKQIDELNRNGETDKAHQYSSLISDIKYCLDHSSCCVYDGVAYFIGSYDDEMYALTLDTYQVSVIPFTHERLLSTEGIQLFSNANGVFCIEGGMTKAIYQFDFEGKRWKHKGNVLSSISKKYAEIGNFLDAPKDDFFFICDFNDNNLCLMFSYDYPYSRIKQCVPVEHIKDHYEETYAMNHNLIISHNSYTVLGANRMLEFISNKGETNEVLINTSGLDLTKADFWGVIGNQLFLYMPDAKAVFKVGFSREGRNRMSDR